MSKQTFNSDKGNSQKNSKELEMEDQLDLLWRNTADAVFMFDYKAKIMHVNPAFTKMLGWTEAEILSRADVSIIPKHYKEDQSLLLERILNGEVINFHYTERIRKDGKHIHVLASYHPITNEQGEVIGATAMYKDMSEQVRVEQALSESEKRYQQLIEHTPYMIVVHDTLNILYINNSGVEMLKATNKEEIYERAIYSFLNPDDVNRFSKILTKMQKVNRAELQINCIDGKKLFVEFTTTPITYSGRQAFQTVLHDITKRKQAEKALRNSEKDYRTISEHSTDMISVLNKRGKVIYASPSHENILGYDANKLINTNLYAIIHPEDRKIVLKVFTTGVSQREGQSVECRLKSTNGDWVWVEARGTPFINEEGELEKVVIVKRDITERKQYEAELEYMAFQDSLTGLPNRRSFLNQLDILVSQGKSPFTIFYLDVDRFKYVNDSLGHHKGDELLKAIANRLIDVEDFDHVARLSGDEFVLLAEGLHDDKDITVRANKLLKIFKRAFSLNNFDFHLGASIGIATYPNDGEDSLALLKNADSAMYEAKDNGKNQYKIYHPSMNERTFEWLVLENDLHKALEKNEFFIEYQPRIDMVTKKVAGAEALIRWNHPTYSRVNPANFIPLAEETGLIIPIGKWVLHTACQQLKSWHNAGYANMKMSVNFSARQFLSESLIKDVEAAIISSGIKPADLEIEITESTLLQNELVVLSVLKELKDMGVQITLDDFGTGYASLTYLTKYHVDALKIDKSFIKDISKNSEKDAITTAVITLAHSLNMRVVAEGVETDEDYNHLLSKSTDEIQGYFISRPIAPDTFQKALNEGNFLEFF
jgi:diguanylate cyclase (GGDEF)-like protein/PAS domain S-box-containing protein